MYFFAWENPATKPYLGSKVNRAAGRIPVNACGSVTIDVPMMRMPTYRASGSDREECKDAKVGDHPFPAKVSPQRLGMGVLGANFKVT